MVGAAGAVDREDRLKLGRVACRLRLVEDEENKGDEEEQEEEEEDEEDEEEEENEENEQDEEDKEDAVGGCRGPACQD